MGGNDAASTGNAIAQASLDESRRQYREQKAKEEAQKARAKANATSVRTSADIAYSNQLQQSTNISAVDQGNYSLISTAVGTPPVINDLMGGNRISTLGG